MNRLLPRYLAFVLGLVACISLSLPVNAATMAGRVVFALGKPTAKDTAGTERVLARGDQVYSGDSLSTAAKERLQLSMADGAFISVQPNSTYVIENYVYNGKPDGTEEATYHLVKGGIRALTGLIGKSKPGAYKVKTAAATIGIRGTGHNTRICQGNCGNLPDGLYHNTWEGITFVANKVDTKEVPTGRGVYVKDMNTKIEFLQQVPAIVASVVAQAKKKEEKSVTVEDEEKSATNNPEQVVPVSQPQVTSTTNMLSKFFMVLTGTDPTTPDYIADFDVFKVYGFFNNAGQLIGALLTEPVSSTSSTTSSSYYELSTIDLTAMQSGSDPVATQLINDVMTTSASDSTLASNISLLQQNPASVAEFSSDSTLGVGWGRWSNGHVLSLYYDSGSGAYSQIYDLTNNQSVHFIYGPQPPATLPTLGTATFNFLGGTQSTSLGGSTIGQGVTGGSISFNFATDFGSLNMDVSHDSAQYAVTADLYTSTTSGTGVNIIVGGGSADTTATTSSCDGSCGVDIIGHFAGATSDGNPQFINLHYQVDETDPFIGVASFKFDSIAVPSSTVIPIGGLVAVEPLPTDPTVADVTLGQSGYGFLDGSNQLIGVIFTNILNGGTRDFGTSDISAVLGGDNATAVAEVQSLYNAAPNAASSATAVASNPATLADYSYDSTDGIGWGRWTNGEFLSFDDTGDPAEVHYLAGNQSVHFIFGSQPPDISGLTSTAYYNFMGGTHSTSTSGATVGNGVTSGTIMVNFSLSQASLDMTVEHAPYTYNVSYGNLTVNNTDATLSGMVTASSDSSTCISCNVNIDGGFAGPAVSTMEPKYIGIQYNIQEPDVITGVAGFQYFVP
jgi:hypothetical protein